ncbi:hypothetical protein P389DRAFT_195548 [Cystobasidium minutum MCA 4210]|uniref:uncharacterized protein n=1 Tax=Cystobasidium minutum MCA 4210 TaxID=1397322 RepID=UPI0034CFCF6D|eukprot:jgi/Rhomi1/195548/gm1.3762_g
MLPTALLAGVLVLPLLSVSAILQPSENNASWKHRLQAKRDDVVKHLQGVPRRLGTRASATPCLTVLDKNNACCPTTALNKESECCPQDQVLEATCIVLLPSCCDDGELYGQGLARGCCRFPGVVYTPGPPSNGVPGCCESAVVTPSGFCCGKTQHVEGESCVENVVEAVIWQRDLESGSAMTKRSEETTRTLLSPALVAEHLINNGVFTYRGVEHVDVGHRAHNEGVLRRIAGRGLSRALKYAMKFNVEYDAEKWNQMDYFGFSDSYEFDVNDVPEIYARIVARPEFESFTWKGASFDREALYNLVKGHPGFNASLVEQYR